MKLMLDFATLGEFLVAHRLLAGLSNCNTLTEQRLYHANAHGCNCVRF